MSAQPAPTKQPTVPTFRLSKVTPVRFPYGGGEFLLNQNGLWYFQQDEENQQKPILISSPIQVLAKSRNEHSFEWGRLLEWRDEDENLHQWVMPAELLQGEGVDWRKALASRGLTISPGKVARELLAAYIQLAPVAERVLCVSTVGWHNDIFITPNHSFGNSSEATLFQSNCNVDSGIGFLNDKNDWRINISEKIAGNSRAIFAISSSLAAPLMNLAGIESGGFHFRGPSSIGKSTILQLSATVYGDPATFVKQWRATANGLEAAASAHNDLPLILDELSQMSATEISESIYLLFNGKGKARARSTGSALPTARWRIIAISTGEESLLNIVSRESGRVNTGQEIRFADIPADAGLGLGIFENMGDFDSASSFAEYLKTASTKYYGAVGMQWLHHIACSQKSVLEILPEMINQFVSDSLPPKASGQIFRVARRFGLSAAAGELATQIGLTGWEEGESIWAAQSCFRAWQESFGQPSENKEVSNILAHVRGFLQCHGASRFQNLDISENQKVSDRVGFFKTDDKGRQTFFMFVETFREVMCAHHDTKMVESILLNRGWIEPGGDGRATQKPRIMGRTDQRFYVFSDKIWSDDDQP